MNRPFVFSARLLGLIAMAGMMAACSKGQFDYLQVNSGYDAGQGRWVPYTRSMAADVSGNPFAIPQNEFDAKIAKAIQAPGYIPTRTGARVRMVFNGQTGDYICGSSGEGGTAIGHDAGGTIRLAAAYCSGDHALTYSAGSISDVSGPDDPNFRSFVRNMAVYLFPMPETTHDPNNCHSSMGC